MKDDESLVEAAVKMLVLVFIMYLLASTWYFTFLQYRNGSSANTPDDMSLAGLARLSFNDNSTNSQLLHAGFWSTALAESGRTIAYMAHDSIFGLIQSSKQWNDLFSENMDNPPPWLSQGLPLYLANFFAKLDAEAIGAGNAAAAGRVMKNFTSFVAGLSAAGVDFASYNGLSALRQYLSTGSVTESAATTFPGQIYKLYSLAFNSSYPEQARAQFLGKALAITGIVIVTAGHRGFSDKFEGMLSRLNLLEAWPKIKAYLKDIGTTSPTVAYGAAMVLEKLASRFPETFKDASGLTADRIDTMVQVLKDKGLTPDEIKGKVAEVAKVAEESNDVGSSAEAADIISYDSEGAMRVKIGKNLIPYLHSEKHYSGGTKTMKRYVLIKEYNPAYDFWLRAHLKEKRIMGDREYSWKEAQQILIDLDERGRTDEFFQSHFLAWRDHPEYPPAYLYLLRLILPIYAHGEIDLGKMAQLDREARIRHQRILFSLDDAASDFYDFYAKVITQPLERDLERGASGRTLSNYFEFEEHDQIPAARAVGLDTVEKAVHKVAVELLRQLQKITLDKILCDT